MSDQDYQEDIDLISHLRDGYDDEQETAVIAPKLPISQRIKLRMSSYGTNKRLKTSVIYSLMLFMGLMIAGQLILQGITALNAAEAGPIPLSTAIEQVEDDLMPIPPPPPPS